MAVVLRELATVVPKRIWPHATFSQITADTCGELMAFSKRLGLTHEKMINMRFHPHFRLNKDMFDRAVALGAESLSKQKYDSFVSQNHN